MKNELWATNGPRGISNIPRPFETLSQPWSQILFLIIVLCILAVVYFISQKAHRSPWGRVMRAIRDNDKAAEAIGKNVERFRIQAFVLGC